MRSNTKAVLEAFLSGKTLNKCPAIHTDGRYVYSYGVVIATHDPKVMGGFLVTSTTYSRTTTCQTHGIHYGLILAKKSVRLIDSDDFILP